jgi:erythromycin esterase
MIESNMKTIFVALALSLGILPAARAGIDGQWVADMPTGPSGPVLELKSDGDRLTGWLSEPDKKLQIDKGVIHGNTLSFEMAMDVKGQSLTLLYTGELSGDELHLTLSVRGMPGEERITMRRVDPKGSLLAMYAENPAPEEVTAWLKANAIRLASVQATDDFADMAPLKARLQDALIVGMGEATHGTREFQQFKFRMFRFLVEQLGFTVFGIESNWPESLEVNRYILGADVDPLPGLGFEWWQTEDMMVMLQWMRQYNQNPFHAHKLKFFGFDMQTPGVAESNVLDYLGRVDPGARVDAARVFTLLGKRGENKEYEAASAELKRRTAEGLGAFLRRFDERKLDYMAHSSQEDWTMARQNAVIVKQAEVKLADQGERGKAARDRSMGDNVKWILDHEPPGTKIMLWAHNAHVATAAPQDSPEHLPMGGRLRELYGDRYVSCGFVFQQGGFRAVDMAGNGIRSFTVGPPPGGSIDATFAALGLPLFAIDLRHLPAGKAADWFAGPHVSRQIGGGYSESTPGVWLLRMRAAQAYDLLIFVDKTTPSKPF